MQHISIFVYHTSPLISIKPATLCAFVHSLCWPPSLSLILNCEGKSLFYARKRHTVASFILRQEKYMTADYDLSIHPVFYRETNQLNRIMRFGTNIKVSTVYLPQLQMRNEEADLTGCYEVVEESGYLLAAQWILNVKEDSTLSSNLLIMLTPTDFIIRDTLVGNVQVDTTKAVA